MTSLLHMLERVDGRWRVAGGLPFATADAADAYGSDWAAANPRARQYVIVAARS